MAKQHKKAEQRSPKKTQPATQPGRFDTLEPGEGMTHYGPIPVHPEPSIYETTLAEVTEGVDGHPTSRFVDHVVIDDIIGPHQP